MSKRQITFLFLAALAIVAFFRLGPSWQKGEEERAPLENIASVDGRGFVHLAPAGKSIIFFEDRINRHPLDLISYTMLGQLHVRQAREKGDVASYQRAEAALRKAVQLHPDYSPAKATLASVFYAQHDFAEALKSAQHVHERDPNSIQALATMGDAHLALGNYPQAEDAYLELLRRGPNPPILARLARLKELRGDTAGAMELMRRAAGEELDAGLSRESVAWYLLRLGDIHFSAGGIDEAGEHYEAALRVFDSYHLALAALGKARAAQLRYDEAIDLYERAVAIIPQPATLAALGDLYAKTAKPAEAQLQYDTVEFIAKLAAINRQVYNRELALFYADHDLKLDEALDLASKELAVRKDIYGYDALAWALYKNGRLHEAAKAITEAMKLGTQDPKLYYHAGMIYYHRGDRDLARTYLEHALALNPHFSILYEDRAGQTLSELREELAFSSSPGAATQ